MIVAIVGSRSWPDLDRVARYITALAAKHPYTVIVSGGARGVDRTAEETARSVGLAVISYRPYEYENMEHCREYSIETVTCGNAAQNIVVNKSRRISPPFFSSFAKAAFFRNGWIVDDADRFVAFWDGTSAGTMDSIGKANRADVPCYIYRA